MESEECKNLVDLSNICLNICVMFQFWLQFFILSAASKDTVYSLYIIFNIVNHYNISKMDVSHPWSFMLHVSPDIIYDVN